MSGEMEANVSGWTTDTLHALMVRVLSERDKFAEERDRRIMEVLREKDIRDQQRFDAQEKAVGEALLAQEKAVVAAMAAANLAVNKAEIASEKRLDSVNEFRGQLKDQQAGLFTRAEAEARINALTDQISEIKDRLNRNDGKSSGYSASWGYLVGGIGITTAVLAILHELVVR